MKDESDKNDEIEIIEENNFSVNQKSFFLTFPHCDIEKGRGLTPARNGYCTSGAFRHYSV